MTRSERWEGGWLGSGRVRIGGWRVGESAVGSEGESVLRVWKV